MTRRYRIAFVAACPFPYPRGTPIRILRAAEALAKRGHKVHVVAYHLSDDRPLDCDITIHRTPAIPTYRHVEPGPTYQKVALMDPLLAHKLWRVVRTHDIDIIHAHHYEGLLTALAVKRLTGLPVVYDAHTMLESELPYYGLGMPHRVKKWLGRRIDVATPHRADHIVAVTSRLRNQLIEWARVRPDQVTVVQTGVELEHFSQPGCGDLQSAPEKPPVLAYSGNLAPFQGIDLMLAALAEAVQTRSDLQLRIITDAPFAPYEQTAGRLGVRQHIQLVHGDYGALPGHLAAACVALNPRLACEGLPQKMLNYMAAAKAIVTFRGSASGLVHGETGWLVEDGDISGFAQGILALLADPELACRMGKNARRYARTSFTWDSTAERLEHVYADLA